MGWLDAKLAAAVTAAVVFAASAFAGIDAGLAAYTPGQLALLRFVTASALLAGYIGATRTKLPKPALRDLPAIALAGILAFSVYNIALGYGQLTVPAGTASLLIATIPAFTALWAAILLHERLGGRGWTGIAVSLAGIALISVGKDHGFGLNLGALLVLLAALSASVYFAFQKPYLARYGAFPFTTYAIWAATVFLLPFAPGTIAQIQQAPLEPTLAAIYLGVSTPLAYATAAYAFTRMQASRAVTIESLIPPTAILIAWLWLGQVPPILSLVGGAIAVFGVALVHLRTRRDAPAMPRLKKRS